MPKLSLVAIAIASVASSYVLATGCSSKDDPGNPAVSDTGTTADAGAELTKFSPKGCAYTVARTKVEQLGMFELHADVASADPQLKNVRRGLGGEVDHGTAAYADPSKSFTVGWQTEVSTLASRIRYGESPDKLDQAADGFSFVIPQQIKIGPEDGLRFHEVHVCGLTPGRTYHYQVGGGAPGKEVWSPVYSTSTAPAAKDAVKIGISGDSRDELGRTELPVWRSIAGRYKADGTHLVLFSGDMVLMGVNQDNWDRWMTATGVSGTSVFYALSPGNHENEQARAFAHMLMPGAATANAERYSSFDYGPVHIVMIDDYPGIVSSSIDDTAHREELLAWLDADLTKANANRAAVPWIVTFHHHPFYSDTTRTERAKDMASVRGALQALWDKHKVDVDLAGHDHFYERFRPLLAGEKEDAKGTTYMVNGASGAPSYGLLEATPLAAFKTRYDPDKGEGIYGIATVDTASFKVKMYKLAASGSTPADDTVIDEFEVAKK
ncbi:MAG: metallophosphoesterase family protein [Deltaproteobacteria bacterium]|nr:metallophosphoesterase family protein [Deltaproteobacteria bacterium]